MKAYLALGSNLEPRESYLLQAISALKELGKVEKIAPLYQSEPYGQSCQPPFLNSAVVLNTPLVPLDLLKKLKIIESRLGRQKRYYWGPREIDLDIIFYGRHIVQEAELCIPHRDYQNRPFVLQPLKDIVPQFVAPDARITLEKALKKCPKKIKLTLIKKQWAGNGFKF